ncbi:MAG: hypothetical protein WA087_01025 [Candidatus Saccharimonadales bacterium]
MRSKNLQATSMRSILMFLLATLIIISAAGFYFAQDWLDNMADDVSNSSSSANPSDSNAQALSSIKTEIAKNKSAADKANSLVSTNANYKAQMAKDINKYASQTGVSIKSINVNQPPTASDISNDIQTGYATVVFNNPVSIQNLLLFIKCIETNSPKMQISEIDITAQKSSSSVIVKPITIRGYFK